MPFLPNFKRTSRKSADAAGKKELSTTTSPEGPKDAFYPNTMSKSQVSKATSTRMTWCIITAVCLFIAVIFLIMTEIGNTYNKTVLRNIWFIKLDLTNVVPSSYPQAELLNSVARTLGLHDFYQVGLWNYCEGYNDQGVTDCTHPEALYYFNPVDIILSQLLSGASIQLPTDISDILDLIKVASNWMFGLFLAGACLSFALIPFMLCSVASRWVAFLFMILTFFNALMIIAASVIATVMFIIMRNVFQNADQVNIGAEVGTTMFAMMWVASAFALFAFLIQTSLTCCCASRRDVRKGKKRGNKKAYA